MSEQADIEAALARATAAYKLVSAERDALKDATDRAEKAEAENDRLREELIGLMRAHDQLGDMFAGVSAENDRLREALTIFADWYQTHPDATLPLGLQRADFALARAALAKEAGE